MNKDPYDLFQIYGVTPPGPRVREYNPKTKSYDLIKPKTIFEIAKEKIPLQEKLQKAWETPGEVPEPIKIGAQSGKRFLESTKNLYNFLTPEELNIKEEVPDLPRRFRPTGLSEFAGNVLGETPTFLGASGVVKGVAKSVPFLSKILQGAVSKFPTGAPMTAAVTGGGIYGASQTPGSRELGAVLGSASPLIPYGALKGIRQLKQYGTNSKSPKEINEIIEAIPDRIKAPIGEMFGSKKLENIQQSLKRFPFSGMEKAYQRVEDYAGELGQGLINKLDRKTSYYKDAAEKGMKSPEEEVYKSIEKGYEQSKKTYDDLRKMYLGSIENLKDIKFSPETIGNELSLIKNKLFDNWKQSKFYKNIQSLSEHNEIPPTIQKKINNLKSLGDKKSLETANLLTNRYKPDITLDEFITGTHSNRHINSILKKYWSGATEEEKALRSIINTSNRYNLESFKAIEPYTKALNEKWREFNDSSAGLGFAKERIGKIKDAIHKDLDVSSRNLLPSSKNDAEKIEISKSLLNDMNRHYAENVKTYEQFGTKSSPFYKRHLTKEKITSNLVDDYIKPDAAGDSTTGIKHLKSLLYRPDKDADLISTHILKPAFTKEKVDIPELVKIYNSFGENQKKELFGDKYPILEKINIINKTYPKLFSRKETPLREVKSILKDFDKRILLGVGGGIGYTTSSLPTMALTAGAVLGSGRAATKALTSKWLKDFIARGGKIPTKPAERASKASLLTTLGLTAKDNR